MTSAPPTLAEFLAAFEPTIMHSRLVTVDQRTCRVIAGLVRVANAAKAIAEASGRIRVENREGLQSGLSRVKMRKQNLRDALSALDRALAEMQDTKNG